MKNIVSLMLQSFKCWEYKKHIRTRPHVLLEWKQTESTKIYWKVHTNVKRLEFCMRRIHKVDLVEPSRTYKLQAKGEHDVRKLDDNIEKE